MTAQPRVRQTPLSELHANPANPRTISEARLEQLKRSLEADRDMLTARPLIALPDGRVIAGNMRLRAATELGWKTIPAITVDLDEERAQLWLLRDNQEYGEWDDASLAMLLEDLAGGGADLDLSGFDTSEVERLLDSLRPPVEIVDPEPCLADEAQERWRVSSGDLWLAGEQRILCGDCTDPAALGRVLDGRTADMLLTDPPYGINLDTDYSKMPGGNAKSKMNRKGRRYEPVIGDDAPFDPRPVAEALESTREQFWFGADKYRRLLTPDDADGSWLVWDKRSEDTDVVIGSGFELVWSRHPHKRDLLRHYWNGALGVAEARNRSHPTQKPVSLLCEIIRRWSPDGAVIADPYLGAGSTLLACEQEGRLGCGVEIDPRYVAVTLSRLEALGLQPERVS